MSATKPRLVYMANQIATAFRAQGADAAVESTLEHIWRYWDPRMRRLVVEHLEAGGAGLDDIARVSVAGLAERLKARS